MSPWKTTINQSSSQTLKIAQRKFHQITSLVLSQLSNDCHGRRILGRGRSFSAGRKDDTTPSTAASPRTGPVTQRLARSQWQAYLIQSATHIIDILMIQYIVILYDIDEINIAKLLQLLVQHSLTLESRIFLLLTSFSSGTMDTMAVSQTLEPKKELCLRNGCA